MLVNALYFSVDINLSILIAGWIPVVCQNVNYVSAYISKSTYLRYSVWYIWFFSVMITLPWAIKMIHRSSIFIDKCRKIESRDNFMTPIHGLSRCVWYVRMCTDIVVLIWHITVGTFLLFMYISKLTAPLFFKTIMITCSFTMHTSIHIIPNDIPLRRWYCLYIGTLCLDIW